MIKVRNSLPSLIVTLSDHPHPRARYRTVVGLRIRTLWAESISSRDGLEEWVLENILNVKAQISSSKCS